MIARLNLFLAAVLLLSAFWLVRSSNEARGLFVQLEHAQAQEKQLQVEFDRLKVDRRTAATPLVVEDMVRTRLHMFNATPAVTHYVNGAGVPVPRGSASLAASAMAASAMAASAAASGVAP
jgi:cell division protein FtsL